MSDPLLYSESLLCWTMANYAWCTDPGCDDPAPLQPRREWPRSISLWCAGCAAFLLALSGFGGHQIAAAAFVIAGSHMVRWLRRSFIPVNRFLEFELAANGIAAMGMNLLCGTAASWWVPNLGLALDRGQWSVLVTGAALLLYMIRGGNYMVRGILRRAGGLPDAEEPGFETREGYAHGRMIGQVERIIVVLVVMGGSLQALAFFFAAKGLIRSKELEERPRADYFLLGSLASFLVALAAGLILQRVIAGLWK
jgi:hypothetical protein